MSESQPDPRLLDATISVLAEIGWEGVTLEKVAERAGVGIVTVRQLEADSNEPRRATLEVVKQALERTGVDFIDENGGGPGVRMRKRRRTKCRAASSASAAQDLRLSYSESRNPSYPIFNEGSDALMS